MKTYAAIVVGMFSIYQTLNAETIYQCQETYGTSTMIFSHGNTNTSSLQFVGEKNKEFLLKGKALTIQYVVHQIMVSGEIAHIPGYSKFIAYFPNVQDETHVRANLLLYNNVGVPGIPRPFHCSIQYKD